MYMRVCIHECVYRIDVCAHMYVGGMCACDYMCIFMCLGVCACAYVLLIQTLLVINYSAVTYSHHLGAVYVFPGVPLFHAHCLTCLHAVVHPVCSFASVFMKEKVVAHFETLCGFYKT